MFVCRDTSGVLLLTRHKESAKWLANLFQQRKVIKKYWSVNYQVNLVGVSLCCMILLFCRAITVGAPQHWSGKQEQCMCWILRYHINLYLMKFGVIRFHQELSLSQGRDYVWRQSFHEQGVCVCVSTIIIEA